MFVWHSFLRRGISSHQSLSIIHAALITNYTSKYVASYATQKQPLPKIIKFQPLPFSIDDWIAAPTYQILRGTKSVSWFFFHAKNFTSFNFLFGIMEVEDEMIRHQIRRHSIPYSGICSLMG